MKELETIIDAVFDRRRIGWPQGRRTAKWASKKGLLITLIWPVSTLHFGGSHSIYFKVFINIKLFPLRRLWVPQWHILLFRFSTICPSFFLLGAIQIVRSLKFVNF